MVLKPKMFVVGLGVALFASVGMPVVDAFHGAWWRARDLDANVPEWNLDHGTHQKSVATRVDDPNSVFPVDIRWSGGGERRITLKIFDNDGGLLHENSFAASEDIRNVVWVQCPNPPGGGNQLETLPTYTNTAADPNGDGNMFDVGGIMRNSFCGDDNDPDDAFYFNDFSDYTGFYRAVEGAQPPDNRCAGLINMVMCLLFPPPDNGPLFTEEVPEGSEWDLHLHVRAKDHG